MGSLFSKRNKDGSKKAKRQARENNMHHSTQSLNESGITTHPNPNFCVQRNAGSTQSLPVTGVEGFNVEGLQYDRAHHGQTFHRNQNSEDVPEQFRPVAQPRNMTSQPPGHFQENRLESQPYADLIGEDSPFPPQSPPPPLPNRLKENRRKPVAPATVTVDPEDYLQEQTVYDSPESNSKQKFIAERNYEATFGNDISFRKGHTLQLLNEKEADGWYLIRNLTTQEEGYAPKGWVTLIASNDITSQKYFFKTLDREGAEARLSEPEIPTGTYLLRPSADGYALSLRCETELYELEIRHYKVRVLDKGICYIDADSDSKPFSNINELIKYYTDKPGLRCRLKTPLPQDVSLNELTVKLSDLKIGDKLGSGNFGSVYAGTLHNKQQVAVKYLKEAGSMTVEEFRKEAETMHKLHHPNLVRLLGICEIEKQIIIITERMSKGALLILLREDITHTITFKDLMEIGIQVVDGMCYLEKKGFVHRDLRASNVLVGDGNLTKIADFGLARLLDNYYQHEDFYEAKKGSVFPYKWTAPEAIKLKRFTVKSDVWSFGILLFEMITHGEEPYATMDATRALEFVEKGNRLKRPVDQQCPMALYNIMRQCWMMNPIERPNFADIKETLVELKAKA